MLIESSFVIKSKDIIHTLGSLQVQKGRLGLEVEVKWLSRWIAYCESLATQDLWQVTMLSLTLTTPLDIKTWCVSLCTSAAELTLRVGETEWGKGDSKKS